VAGRGRAAAAQPAWPAAGRPPFAPPRYPLARPPGTGGLGTGRGGGGGWGGVGGGGAAPPQTDPPAPRQVRVATEAATGVEFACKSIAKRLDVPDLSPARQAAHLDNVKREVGVLKALRGTLNVVALRGAYEDATHVHIVMELCNGGELLHAAASRPHYGEATVASFLRAVLRTLTQCHARHILHRDVKPGNFMLLSDDPAAPLKAIDFGLAAFFDPAALPRTDLGLEGTPWFMAPEALASKWGPPADVWAAGVMCYQLL